MSEPGAGHDGGPAAADPALALLRGGAVPALVVGLVLAAASLFAGPGAAAGAAVGTVLACLALASGPIVMRGTQEWSPPAVMAVAMISFGGVVILLGAAFLVLRPLSWLSPGFLAAGLIGSGAAWAAGELRAAWTLRVLAFGSPATGRPTPGPDPSAGPRTGPGTGPDGPGQGGLPGPELPTGH
jgi:hypothetical protein